MLLGAWLSPCLPATLLLSDKHSWAASEPESRRPQTYRFQEPLILLDLIDQFDQCCGDHSCNEHLDEHSENNHLLEGGGTFFFTYHVRIVDGNIHI